MPVRDRSTICNCWQRAQAAGPTQMKSGGRESETIPASRKQHSGKHLFGFAGSLLFLFHVEVTQGRALFEKLEAEIALEGLMDYQSVESPQFGLVSNTPQKP